MTSKERAKLKSLAVNIDPVLQIGKSGITPELTEAVRETFNTRELTKIHILQSCTEDGRALAQTLADRTASEVVQVIGRMIVLYKENKELRQKKEVSTETSKKDESIKTQKNKTEKPGKKSKSPVKPRKEQSKRKN